MLSQLSSLFKSSKETPEQLFLKEHALAFDTEHGTILGEFKHEVRQFEKSYDNQQAEQIFLMV
ncbi:hypothetical protein GPS48_00010 [Acinetobacter haemolyticus]|nr:hypothetical protein [Acinetobacter haemolyticus]